MRRGRVLAWLATLGGVALALFACTSLSGLTNEPSPEGGSPDGDGASETGSGDASSDGAVVCPESLTACGGLCVDTASSQENCGACNHSCGGGSCKGGVCQPVAVRGAISNLAGFAIDPTSVYFAHDDKVESCPLAGCTGAPTQIASMNGKATGPVIEVANGYVYFVSAPSQVTTRPTLYMCPIAGCPAAGPTSIIGPLFGDIHATTMTGNELYTIGDDIGVRHNTCSAGACTATDTIHSSIDPMTSLSADDAGVYFGKPIDGGADVVRCAPGGSCPAPTVMIPNAGGQYTQIAATRSFKGTVYVLFSGGSGFNDGAIDSCIPPACAGGMPVRLVSKLALPSDLRVDDGGYYWIAQDNAAIETCALTGCAGGIRTLAAQQSAPANIRTNDAFVYWMVAGGTIVRVAK